MGIKSHHAFSLVELLATIAIVGILASMSVATFNEYKGRAYDVLSQSAVRDMAIDFNATLVDYGSVRNLVQKLGYMPAFSKLAKSAQDSFHNSSEKRAVIPNVILDPHILASISIINDTNVNFYTAHCKSSFATASGNQVAFQKAHMWTIGGGFAGSSWVIAGGSPRC